MPPFCFQDFGLSLLSLFWILFHIDSLFPPHIFGLVDFYLIPSTTGYFSVFSFCLVYCALSLLSPGWKFIVPLNCGVTPTLCGWVWISACEGFLVGGVGTSEVPVVSSMELDLISLKGSALSSIEFGCIYWFGIALGNLSANVQHCVPVLLKELTWGIWYWGLLAFGWAWF